MATKALYAINRQGDLMVAEIPKSQKFARCPTCNRGAPINRRCHGWLLTTQKPADRKVRLANPDAVR